MKQETWKSVCSARCPDWFYMVRSTWKTILFLSLLFAPVVVNAFISAENQQKACENGNAEACNLLGSRYATGNGVEKNRKQMLVYFGKACDLQDQATCRIFELDEACHRKNSDACYNLGMMYQEGYGVEENHEQALSYFREGCELIEEAPCVAYEVLSNSGGKPRNESRFQASRENTSSVQPRAAHHDEIRIASANHRAYAVDLQGELVVNSWGLCWRNSGWTLSAASLDPAGCVCDKAVLPRGTCESLPLLAEAPVRPRSRHEPAVETQGESASIESVIIPVVPVVPAPSAIVTTTLSADMLFDFNKAGLHPEAKAQLDEIVAVVQKLSLENIVVTGHADRLGKSAYNQKLSEKRAESVKKYLISRGLPANRISAQGVGSTQAVTNDCVSGQRAELIQCLQPDRRVNIEIIGKSSGEI